ncbi:MAG: hypothetical protein KGJ60_14190, partial [Verrucomicrobiota bacterium]|nr:hypothetical protein [Verrucomicrobiota bacterium]
FLPVCLGSETGCPDLWNRAMILQPTAAENITQFSAKEHSAALAATTMTMAELRAVFFCGQTQN